MALDHTRDYFHMDAFTYDPLDLKNTTPWLFATRWIVAAAHPDSSVEVTHSLHHCLVAPAWRAVEPLVHAPQAVQPPDVR